MPDMDNFKRPALPMDLVPTKRGKYEDNMALSTTGAGAQQQTTRVSNLMAPIMLLHGHEGEINTARFSTDGTCLASGGFDQRIFLWNVFGECENFSILKGHNGAVMDLNFNTDSSYLFSCGTDKTLRIWDMQTGSCIRKYKSHTDIVNACHPIRRGPLLVCSASDDGTVKVHDIRLKDPVKSYASKFQQTSITWNDMGDQVIAGGIDNDIKVWDIRRDDITYVLRGHADTVTGISLSPNGNHIISNSMDCSAKMWDVRPFAPANRLIKTFYGHQHNFEKNLLKAAWSPDGERISVGSSDRFTYIWEVSSKKLLYKLPGHHGSVNATDFHPIEPILLSASSDKRIYLGEIA